MANYKFSSSSICTSDHDLLLKFFIITPWKAFLLTCESDKWDPRQLPFGRVVEWWGQELNSDFTTAQILFQNHYSSTTKPTNYRALFCAHELTLVRNSRRHGWRHQIWALCPCSRIWKVSIILPIAHRIAGRLTWGKTGRAFGRRWHVVSEYYLWLVSKLGVMVPQITRLKVSKSNGFQCCLPFINI